MHPLPPGAPTSPPAVHALYGAELNHQIGGSVSSARGGTALQKAENLITHRGAFDKSWSIKIVTRRKSDQKGLLIMLS